MTNDELRKIREELELNQRQLATLLGVTAGAVAQWETGVNPISRLTELAIERVLSWSPQKIARRLRDSE